ncbi:MULTISPECIES: hypothetical protein, partial [unclassified Campylobacter]|uniref:hypothetical protein n=1 Tax=unclassified Campylobacter TaxID=2593542 RepID=UPI0022E9E3E4
PCSIPNQEAKLIMADDTLRYSDVGKVGRCGLCFYSLCFFKSIKFLCQSNFKSITGSVFCRILKFKQMP